MTYQKVLSPHGILRINNNICNFAKKILTKKLAFYKISNLLNGKNTSLYNLQPKIAGSLYDGDFGLLKIYEDINCLLGLIIIETNDNTINCAPQSWMASNRTNRIVENKRPIYMNKIVAISSYLYNQDENLITN